MSWSKEQPTGANPPDGAIVNYYLKTAASGLVTLEIRRADGRLVRRDSSSDPVAPIPDAKSAPVPLYWYRPPQSLSVAAGMHRFLWDVHYQPIAGTGGGGRGGLPIQGIPYNSPSGATTPWVAPGTYTVTLTAGGKSYSQPVTVQQDPRVTTPHAVTQQVHALTDAMYFGAVDAQEAVVTAAAMREQAGKIQAQGAAADALAAFVQKLAALEGQPQAAAGGGRGAGPGGAARGEAAPASAPGTLRGVATLLTSQMNVLESADVAPTANTLAAVTAALTAGDEVMARWAALLSKELPALNATLKADGLPGISGGPGR